MTLLAALLLSLAQPALSDGAAPTGAAAIEDGFARRGAVVARLDGAAALSVLACRSACAVNQNCQAYTWRRPLPGREARCDLHAMALTPFPDPGAATGLSPDLAARIEAASDRAPTAREREALSAVDGGEAPPRDDSGLLGG